MVDESDDGATEQPSKPAGRQVVHIELDQKPGESKAQAMARHLLSLDLDAATTVREVMGLSLNPDANAGFPVEVNPLMDELARHARAVESGEDRGEAMLSHQARTLDAAFNSLLRKGMQLAEGARYAVDAVSAERFLRLAFKAQAQARSTWEAIAEIRNPRQLAIVKADQANIAATQQVNNNARGSEKTIAPNELNGVAHEVDGRGEAPAIGISPAVATLDAIDRAAIARGQGQELEERGSGRGAGDAAQARKTAKADRVIK